MQPFPPRRTYVASYPKPLFLAVCVLFTICFLIFKAPLALVATFFLMVSFHLF